MRPLFPLLLLSAACSPSGAEAEPPEAAQPPDYATQIEVPTPDYAAMMAGPGPEPREAEIVREASAPLPADAKTIGETWIARLEERGALMGYGLEGKGPDGPANNIDTLLTAREFDAWVAENGWTAPTHIRWYFQSPLVAPRVSEAAQPKIPFWPASIARTGWQLEAAESGRIFVRDGCFFVTLFDGVEKLAWFHSETGLDVDDEGYLVLADRGTGEAKARLGEMMQWAAPNYIDQDDPRLAALHRACGAGEVHGVGNPQALERMYVEYPHLREPHVPPPPPPVASQGD